MHRNGVSLLMTQYHAKYRKLEDNNARENLSEDSLTSFHQPFLPIYPND